MTEDFEYRDDPKIAEAAGGSPREVCAVKVDAFKKCAAFVRGMAGRNDANGRAAQRLVDLLDHVGLTPDYDPMPIDRVSP